MGRQNFKKGERITRHKTTSSYKSSVKSFVKFWGGEGREGSPKFIIGKSPYFFVLGWYKREGGACATSCDNVDNGWEWMCRCLILSIYLSFFENYFTYLLIAKASANRSFNRWALPHRLTSHPPTHHCDLCFLRGTFDLRLCLHDLKPILCTGKGTFRQ